MDAQQFSVLGNLVDLKNRIIFPAKVTVKEGMIYMIERTDEPVKGFIMPGFIDAHIHIESSMLVPTEFSKIATTFGTVATVSDPHEIANVCGLDGVEYMLNNAALAPLKFNFGAPSCVPATNFETSGAVIDAEDIELLLDREDIKYLTEMMNYPGVIYDDPLVMEKIALAQKAGKPIDGHAPGLFGDDMKKYVNAGISTDHECFTLEEALGKINAGMKILIREGSAAKNFDALVDLFSNHAASLMFCSDDKHPDELIKGHINELVIRALNHGANLFDVLCAACVNPVEHYSLDVGLLEIADPADFIIVEDLSTFNVNATYIDGKLVAENGKYLIEDVPIKPINHFECLKVTPEELIINSNGVEQGKVMVKVIEAIDGQLITNLITTELNIEGNKIVQDITNDILKIVVYNRYKISKPAVGFIKNFGLNSGAIGSTVAHDSHNIVVIGTSDEDIAKAINTLIDLRGGIVAIDGAEITTMSLPIAGLMTAVDGVTASNQYQAVDKVAKKLGSKLSAPFMTLSFMALPVIPNLKMTDLGLFDVQAFNHTNLFINN